MYFLLFSCIFFLLSSIPTPHIYSSSLSGFSFSIPYFLPFLLYTVTSSRSYSVTPGILSSCRIVSSETLTTKRFCSVRLQLKCCTEIVFPRPYNLFTLGTLKTSPSLKHWNACNKGHLFIFKKTFPLCRYCHALYLLFPFTDNLQVTKPPQRALSQKKKPNVTHWLWSSESSSLTGEYKHFEGICYPHLQY